VAAGLGGHGWQSENSGGIRYQWRGIAPRVLFISGPRTNFGGSSGDVNNHSHTTSLGNYYDGGYGGLTYDYAVDDVMYPASQNTNIVVYAAANSGGAGYYSLLVNAKNCITVGAIYSRFSHQGQPLRCDFSSMGPTRDGRIKPDIMAPGNNWIMPLGTPAAPIKIYIDSVAFLDSAGAVKVGWGFTTGDMHWGTIEPPSYIDDVDAQAGCLVLQDTSYYASVWSDSLSHTGLYPMTYGKDSLYIRYKFEMPVGYQSAPLHCGMCWRVMYDTGSVRGGVPFDLETTPGFHDLRMRLLGTPQYQDFPTWGNVHYRAQEKDTLVAIRLGFDIDTTNGIRAAMSSHREPGCAIPRTAVTGHQARRRMSAEWWR